MGTDVVTLFVCGDVMLGRGVDQILPYPGAPRLREPYVRDARGYVELAEAVNGPIPCPVDFSWPWGEALALLEGAAPDVRVLNLETSVTRSDDFAPGKDVHYRMNPANLPCLAAARPDVCVLANNHVQDFGILGLQETLATLADARLRTAGAGWDAGEARRPAIVEVDGGRRVLVFAFGTASSGIPRTWAAAEQQAGVHFLSEASSTDAAEVVDGVQRVKRPGDIVVASVHWGSNWGYHVSREQVRFAHTLIDGGVDVVHGHSSHHPRPIELYRGRLILHGCGDLIDDYEGIAGYEQYRDDLRLLYFVSVEPDSGELVGVHMAPVQARRMRLEHASAEDSQHLREVLDRVSRSFGVQVGSGPNGMLALRAAQGKRA